MDGRSRAQTREGPGLFPPIGQQSRLTTRSGVESPPEKRGRRRDALRSTQTFKDAVDQHKQFAALRIAEVLGLNKDSEDNLDLVDGAYLERSEWVVSKTPNAPWDLDAWASVAVGFGKVLAKHMRNKIHEIRKKKDIPLSQTLSESDVAAFDQGEIVSIVTAMQSDLCSAIHDAISEIADSGPEDEEPHSSKFTVENEMWIHAEDGDIAQGHLMLQDQTGPPAAQFLTGMYTEHCASSDSDSVFTVNSYGGVVTTPRLEWEFVAGLDAVQEDGSFSETSTLDMGKAFPDDIGRRPARRGRPGGRERKHVSEFVKLELAKRANLTPEEAIALRLWTGPMHLKYNAVLSGHPKGIEYSLGSNRYSTTIHLILQAMVKVSPFQELGGWKVFVGLGDQAWHSPIWKPDPLGFKGAFTRGFVSATSSLKTAMTLPWAADHRQIVLEIDLARTSMAVDLSWISQYPHEHEVLIPAFAYYEVTPVFRYRAGVCLSVVRPFAVMTADTVDKDLQGRKETTRRLLDQLVWDAKRKANAAGIAAAEEEAHLAPLRSQADVTKTLSVDWFEDLRKFYALLTTVIELQSSANRHAAEHAWNAARAARAVGDHEQAVRSLQSSIAIASAGCITDESRAAVYEMRKELVGLLDEGSTGLANLHIAAIKNDLGVDLRREGELELGLGLCKSALETRTRELGKEHVLVANAMTNVANILQSMERYEEAIQSYEDALRVTARLVGRDHKNVATQLNNMALLHKKMGNHDKAVQLYRESLEVRVKALGKEHPDVAATLYNLAALFAHKGDRDKAAPMFDRAALIYAVAFGPAHPETKDARKKAVLCGAQPAGVS